jgi:hypothetical protein
MQQSEKVCEQCGLVVPGAFQVLEPRDPYKSRYYETHEQWIEAMTPSDKSNEDVAWDNEQFEHVFGIRPNDQIQDATDGDIFGVISSKFDRDAQSSNNYKYELDYALNLKSKRKLEQEQKTGGVIVKMY